MGLKKVVDWVKAQKFDVIFFETLHMWNLPIMMCCKKARIYQLIHIVTPFEGEKEGKGVNLMNRVVCKLADYIVVTSPQFIPTIAKKYSIGTDKVRYLELLKRFPEYTEPKYTGRALFFGRMHLYKGVDNLLRIAKECPNVHFDVVGSVDPSVQDIVDELKRLPNVTMKNDYVSDEEMAEAFINADWILLPYNSAAKSGVVIDAYRYGRPVIAFNVGAICEQVIDGENGFLIDPGDIESFCSKLQEATQLDHDSYQRMSRAAYEFGVKEYSTAGTVEKFVGLITE
jgi:glycosyltransferase involved in cell wall biosynthesis